MGVEVTGRGTSLGRAVDTPDTVTIFWGRGYCRGCASDPPDAVVVVCGRGLWYWSICLRS